MKVLKVRIELENDALQTKEAQATALRGIARRLEWGETKGRIADINGNTIGSFEIEKEKITE